MDDVDFPGWRPEKSIQVVESNGRSRVLLKGKPYMSWRTGDEGCVRLAMVQLHECGLGTEEDLAAAFGRHVNSVQKHVKDFADEGIRSLITERRGPKGRWKLTPELRGKILLIVLREGIWKLEVIQQRLQEAWHEEVSLPSIQQVLVENGLGEPTPGGVSEAVVQDDFLPRMRSHSWFYLWIVLLRNLRSQSTPAACRKIKAQRERTPLRESLPEPQTWGEDGSETLIRPRSESIWTGSNKVLTMPMLAGCCLRRCWRNMILFRR